MRKEMSMEKQVNDEKALVEDKTPLDAPEKAEDDALLSILEPAEEGAQDLPPDYAAMAEEDLLLVRQICPACRDLESLGDLPMTERFGELRELGLSVREALGAIGLFDKAHDGRSHLRASVSKRLGDSGVRMSSSELASARRLFPGLGEREIARLYRRVSQ